ncbi:hypothetical protein G7054_g8311 [Neopestalotiopsis clavispora]|nr:hypothetical protein G7054_g8311 [Neopestalotiopsis clavispora]
MNSDEIFRDAFATSDLGSLKTIFDDGLHVNTESQNFSNVVRLSITNGDEAAFAKLLTYIPDLRLKSKVRSANEPIDQVRPAAWYILHRIAVAIISDWVVLCLPMVYSAINSTGIIPSPIASAVARLPTSSVPFNLWIILRLFDALKCRTSREILFHTLDTLDGALVFMWLAIATRFISTGWWLGFYLHKGLYSFSSFWGLQIRASLARNMPGWRRSYFSIVLGSDSFLARTPQIKASVSQIDYGYVILEQLLRSQCHEEALMIRFLEKAIFEDIKEKCNSGHEVLIWGARNGSLEVVRKL